MYLSQATVYTPNDETFQTGTQWKDKKPAKNEGYDKTPTP